MEISSMGIRVDAETLDRQLAEAGCEERRNLPFHRMLLEGELPLTIEVESARAGFACFCWERPT